MIEWIEPKRGPGRNPGTEYCSYAVQRYHKAISSSQLRILFSVEALKDLRLIEGDRLLVGFDKATKSICLRRVPEGGKGFKLCVTGGKAEKGKRPTMRVQATVNMPACEPTQVGKENVSIEGAVIVIKADKLFQQ